MQIPQGGILAEEPLLSDGEDAIAADDSYASRHLDEAGTSDRMKSKLIFQPPVALEEQEQRRLNSIGADEGCGCVSCACGASKQNGGQCHASKF